VPQDTLDDLRERLRRTRWPEQVPETGWSRGIDLDYMQEQVRYWADEFDWRKQKEEMAADMRDFFRPLKNELP